MNEKRWNNLWVDKGLKDSWLERLNTVKAITIKGTCSGHHGRPAYVMYVGPKGDRDVVWALAHLGDIAIIRPVGGGRKLSVHVLKPRTGGGFKTLSKAKWWTRVIRWLEFWYSQKM